MNLRSLLVFASLAAVGCSTAPSRVIVIHSARGDRNYRDYRYAPAIRVGDTVYVSGIPANHGATTEEQARAVFVELRDVLAAAGATLDDVVELQSFHAASKDTPAFLAEFDKILAVHKEFFKNGNPAWTAVGTTTLLSGASFELRAAAVVGSGKNTRIQRTY